MIRQPRKIVRRLERPIAVVDVKTEIVLEGDPGNTAELPAFVDCLYQFEESAFPLTPDDDIDVRCIQGCIGVQGRKITAPDDRNAWILGTEFTAYGNSRLHLRTRHDGDGKHGAAGF